MPYIERPPVGRARAKLLAERIRNVTRHFAWQPTQKADSVAEDILTQEQSPTHSRRVFSLAWPVIGENFLQTLLGIVDTFMVASLGAIALAGVGAAIQVMFFVVAALSATSVGSSVLVAQAVGAQQLGQASRLAKQSLVWSIIISIPLLIVGLFAAEPIIAIFGMEPAVSAIGIEYLQVTMGTVVILTLLVLGGGVLRGAGDSRTPMLVIALANLVNIVLTYGLIFGELGMPELGAVGSAWGTFLSRIVGFVILAVVMWRGKNGVSIRGREDWWPEFRPARELLTIGIPAALEQVLTSTAILFMTVIIASLGTETLAAQRIVFNALSISFLPGIGFGLAATALVGQSIGAGQPEEARIVARISMIWAIGWMSALGVCFILFRTAIVGWFSDDPNVIIIGASGLWPLALTQPFWAMNIVIGGSFRGMGNTQFPLWVNTVGIWSAVLLGYLLITLFDGSLAMIWSTFLVTGPASALVMWRSFQRTITNASVL